MDLKRNGVDDYQVLKHMIIAGQNKKFSSKDIITRASYYMKQFDKTYYPVKIGDYFYRINGEYYYKKSLKGQQSDEELRPNYEIFCYDNKDPYQVIYNSNDYDIKGIPFDFFETHNKVTSPKLDHDVLIGISAGIITEQEFEDLTPEEQKHWSIAYESDLPKNKGVPILKNDKIGYIRNEE